MLFVIIFAKYVLARKYFDCKLLKIYIRKKFKTRICRSYIYAILKQNNITYKRVQKQNFHKSSEYIKKEKNILADKLAKCNKDKLISIDESSFVIGEKPNYSWAEKGKPCICKIKPNQKRFSLILAISKKKIINYKLVNGSVNGEIFLDFINDDVIPNSDNGSILMDNARIHHYKKLKQKLSDKSIQNDIIYNVPYHPQYNPIEYVFNVIKNTTCKMKITSMNSLINCLNIQFSKMNKCGFSMYYDHAFRELNNDLLFKEMRR